MLTEDDILKLGDIMILTKEVVSKLNDVAQEDFEKAQAMLDGINMVLKTKYGWLNKRVVFFYNPDAVDKYKAVYDAWVWAK